MEHNGIFDILKRLSIDLRAIRPPVIDSDTISRRCRFLFLKFATTFKAY